MPVQSLFGKRVEPSDRTMVRIMSPQRGTPSSPLVHKGLTYADGTVHRGGKAHYGAPKDHEIINPSKPPPGFTEPTAFFPNGLPVVLGRRTSSPTLTPRSQSPSVTSQSHGSGKKRVAPPTPVTQSPVRQDSRTSSPVSVRHHKAVVAGPADHSIIGVAVVSKEDSTTASSRRTGIRVLEGCPAFQPPAFEKRPYSPQTKRVATKPQDNDIFNVSAGTSPARSGTPTRVTATATGLGGTPSTGAAIRRGPVSDSVTPSRSPAPYAQIPCSSQSPRSRTPSRACPGSSSFNIITGQSI